MRKITDKKHKKVRHHKTINHRSKQHTRKHHAKRQHRRTRRQGGMIQRLRGMCRGISCMTPRQEDVFLPSNSPEISDDITRAIVNGYIELLKQTSTNNNRTSRINGYINIIDQYRNAEGIDFKERIYIHNEYINFLTQRGTTPNEIENNLREIQLFGNIRNLIDQYKLFLRSQQNNSTRGRIIWPPVNSDVVVVGLIETYFNNQLLEEPQLDQDLEAEFNQL